MHPKFSKALAYVKVSRPPLLLMGLFGPLACLKWVDGFSDPLKAGLMLLAIFTGNLAWNWINELEDEDVDRVNKPWKPVPSGQINTLGLSVASVSMLLISLVSIMILTYNYGTFYFLIGSLAHITACIYNVKRRDLFGNICEVVTIALAPLMVMYPYNLHFPLQLGLLFFGIALITQLQDVEAERVKGVLTAPQQLGEGRTRLIAYISLLLSSSFVSFSGWFMFPFWLSALSNLTAVCFINRTEWFSRRLGRAFILVGFICMLLFS